MKIMCECGEVIPAISDVLPNTGHIIPGQDWYDVLDTIDDAIENSGPSPKEKEAALMEVRSFIGKASRSIWQCITCGSLYINNSSNELEHFKPSNNAGSKEILRRAPINA